MTRSQLISAAVAGFVLGTVIAFLISVGVFR